MNDNKKEISIIIPVYNEVENLPKKKVWIGKMFVKNYAREDKSLKIKKIIRN